MWRRSWLKRGVQRRASTPKRSIGLSRSCGRGPPHDGGRTSGSPQGGDGTSDCPLHRFTHQILRLPVYPAQSHRPLHPPARGPHHSRHLAFHHRHRPFRPPVPSLLHHSEPTTNHGTSTLNPHHHHHPPHPPYLRHTKAAHTCRPTFHQSKTRPSFHRQARSITFISPTPIPSVPIHHPPPPLRAI